MDKVEKICQKIERLKGYISVTHFAEELLSFIDSLQQEQPCDTCTNDKGCVTCKDGELWEGKEQSLEELEKAAEDGARQNYVAGGYSPFPNIEYGAYKNGFIAGAEWQEKHSKDGTEEK